MHCESKCGMLVKTKQIQHQKTNKSEWWFASAEPGVQRNLKWGEFQWQVLLAQVDDELRRRRQASDDWMGDAERSEGVQPKGLLE